MSRSTTRSYARHISFVSDSDSIYHRMFSDPRMVEALVREFGPKALASDLDFSGLQRVNPKLYSDSQLARRREADVIWRLPTRESPKVFLYLLIEFQSRSDWWMAVRTQVYQGLVWQQVIDEKKLKTRELLPPLLSLVLYNGVQRWDAPIETGGLIGFSRDSALWRWQPRVLYRLLDMGAFSEDDLVRRTSLVALLFRLERRPSPGKFKELVREVGDWFRQHEGYERLRKLFAELIGSAFVERGLDVSADADLPEIETMIETHFEGWEEYWAAKGKAEGRVEGKAEGKAEALLCILAQKFGPVAAPWRERIRSAEPTALERWLTRVVPAHDVASVFE